jgi:uncharacterized protein
VSDVTGPLIIDRDAVAELCRRYGVKRLAVFGFATTPDFDPKRSDVDFFVDFSDEVPSKFDAYFGLNEELEELFGRRVDLVMPKALENPYFAAQLAEQAEELYAA